MFEVVKSIVKDNKMQLEVDKNIFEIDRNTIEKYKSIIK